jgi:hypothetical protein
MFPSQNAEDGLEPDREFPADRTESAPGCDLEAGEDAPAPEGAEEETAADAPGKSLPTGTMRDWPDEASDGEGVARSSDDLVVGAASSRQPAPGAQLKRKAAAEQPGSSSGSRPTKRRLRKAGGGDPPPQRKKPASGPREAPEIAGYVALPFLVRTFSSGGCAQAHPLGVAPEFRVDCRRSRQPARNLFSFS